MLTTEKLKGLSFLFKGLDAYGSIEKYVLKEYTPLDRHPFNLPLQAVDQRAFFEKMTLLSWPKATQSSVYAMLAVLRACVADAAYCGKKPHYFRIIYAPKFGCLNHHDVFFEFSDLQGTVICGGCTDYSGEGGRGKETLESVFEFLSEAYGMCVERVHLSRVVAEIGQHSLCDSYNAFRAVKCA